MIYFSEDTHRRFTAGGLSPTVHEVHILEETKPADFLSSCLM